jgi:hypothetical protein
MWMRAQIFPTEELMKEWTKNPHLIPEGLSFDITLFNNRSEITLSNKSPSGWLTQIGLSESSIVGVRATTSFVNTGWQYR